MEGKGKMHHTHIRGSLFRCGRCKSHWTQILNAKEQNLQCVKCVHCGMYRKFKEENEMAENDATSLGAAERKVMNRIAKALETQAEVLEGIRAVLMLLGTVDRMDGADDDGAFPNTPEHQAKQDEMQREIDDAETEKLQEVLEEQKPDAPTLSLEDLQKALRGFAENNSLDAARSVLTKFGAKRVSELAEEQYPGFFQEITSG